MIALLIALASGSLILLAYHHKIYLLEYLQYKHLQSNARSAEALLLAETSSVSNGLTIEDRVDLFDNQEDSAILQTRPWGLFEIGSYCVWDSRDTIRKTFLYGYRPGEHLSASIYLADQGRPLLVSGNTDLRGSFYLPKAGVLSAYVENKFFQRQNLYTGALNVSEPELPSISAFFLEHLTALVRNPFNECPDAQLKQLEAVAKDSLVASFTNPLTIAFSEHPLLLDRMSARGHILLFSPIAIHVSKHANLQNVLLIAPSITIEEGFRGCLQAIASDSLIIQKNCLLSYPSSAILIPNITPNSFSTLQLCEKAHLEGIACLVHNNDISRGLVRMDPNSEVMGQVYSSSFAQVQGKIIGNLTCKRLFLQTPSSIYENVLLDATIDNTKLSKAFVGSSLLESKRQKQIIQWLD